MILANANRRKAGAMDRGGDDEKRKTPVLFPYEDCPRARTVRIVTIIRALKTIIALGGRVRSACAAANSAIRAGGYYRACWQPAPPAAARTLQRISTSQSRQRRGRVLDRLRHRRLSLEIGREDPETKTRNQSRWRPARWDTSGNRRTKSCPATSRRRRTMMKKRSTSKPEIDKDLDQAAISKENQGEQAYRLYGPSL